MRNEMIYNSIELNIQRMTMYRNISLENIRKKKKKKKKKKGKRKNTFGDVCWFF